MIKAAIFDVDGTLLDSMPIWMDAGARFIRSLGIEPMEKLGEKMWDMSIPEGAAFMKEQHHLELSVEEIMQGVVDTVRDFYYTETPLKPGVLDFLLQVQSRDIPMVIATSSDRSYLDAALKRTGISQFFQRIFTCQEVGAGKTKPVIYEVAAEYLGETPEDIFVFEDVIHAVRSAKGAGFQVAGIYDEVSRKDLADMKEACDIFLQDFTEGEAFWNYVTHGGNES